MPHHTPVTCTSSHACWLPHSLLPQQVCASTKATLLLSLITVRLCCRQALSHGFLAAGRSWDLWCVSWNFPEFHALRPGPSRPQVAWVCCRCARSAAGGCRCVSLDLVCIAGVSGMHLVGVAWAVTVPVGWSAMPRVPIAAVWFCLFRHALASKLGGTSCRPATAD